MTVTPLSYTILGPLLYNLLFDLCVKLCQDPSSMKIDILLLLLDVGMPGAMLRLIAQLTASLEITAVVDTVTSNFGFVIFEARGGHFAAARFRTNRL